MQDVARKEVVVVVNSWMRSGVERKEGFWVRNGDRYPRSPVPFAQ